MPIIIRFGIVYLFRERAQLALSGYKRSEIWVLGELFRSFFDITLNREIDPQR